jgi:predicted RNA-binding Zn-ribbon protein involved in translation (DUF1610 family)
VHKKGMTIGLLNGRKTVGWNCPKCGHRNEGRKWTGRGRYMCEVCQYWTELKQPPMPIIYETSPGHFEQRLG